MKPKSRVPWPPILPIFPHMQGLEKQPIWAVDRGELRPNAEDLVMSDASRLKGMAGLVRPLCTLSAAVLAACSASMNVPVLDGALAVGTWGGERAGMTVGESATHLHIDCTVGDVPGRIAVDGNRRFDVTGSYLLRAFPVAVGPTMPARFTGRLDGANAIITVTVNDTVERKTTVLGPVVVTYGREPKLMPCPICRRPSR
jgi:hypothetical protein